MNNINKTSDKGIQAGTVRKGKKMSRSGKNCIGSQKRWWRGGLVGALAVMVLLTIPQSAATWWPDALNPVTWAKEAADYFSDNVMDILDLTWDVIRLDPEEAWDDIKDIASNQVCFGSLTVLGLAISAGLEEDFDECDVPPHPIEPDVLAKLSLYSNSDFNSVRIHEGCNLDADLIPGNDAPKRDAITFGEHIYFKPKHYHPRDPVGFALLAHELTHVLQYRKKGFSDFICEYGLNCRFGANRSCAIEQQADEYQELVENDQYADKDGVFTPVDNCPDKFNPKQEDTDGDKFGDSCDTNPLDPFQLRPSRGEDCGDDTPVPAEGCSSGKSWDPWTCECTCDSWEAQNCGWNGGYWDEDTCTCEDPDCIDGWGNDICG